MKQSLLSLGLARVFTGLLAIAATSATATPMTFTDQTAFNAAVTGQVSQDFDSFSSFYNNRLNVPMSGYTISASSPGYLFAGSGLLTTNNPYQPLIFTFTGTLPTAVGGLFLTTGYYFAALSSTLTISLNDGTFINLPAPTGGGLNLTGAFAGFTSDVGITSLTVGGPFSSEPDQGFATVNALYVGTAVSATVPEPSALALVGLALAGLALSRRRA